MIRFNLIILLQLVVLYTQNQAAASDIYYITTSSTSDLICTVQPCLILSQFAANSSSYLHSGNTTLVFLPGTHYLSNVNLTLENVDNFVLKSENIIIAQIKCTSDSHIYFRQSQCIHITNMEFIGCGNNIVEVVTSFLVNNTKFEGLNNSGTALELIGTEAQFSTVHLCPIEKVEHYFPTTVLSQ